MQREPTITLSYQTGWNRAFLHFSVDGKSALSPCSSSVALLRMHALCTPLQAHSLMCSLAYSKNRRAQSVPAVYVRAHAKVVHWPEGLTNEQ